MRVTCVEQDPSIFLDISRIKMLQTLRPPTKSSSDKYWWRYRWNETAKSWEFLLRYTHTTCRKQSIELASAIWGMQDSKRRSTGFLRKYRERLIYKRLSRCGLHAYALALSATELDVHFCTILVVAATWRFVTSRHQRLGGGRALEFRAVALLFVQLNNM
jgi:hypothetical protein